MKGCFQNVQLSSVYSSIMSSLISTSFTQYIQKRRVKIYKFYRLFCLCHEELSSKFQEFSNTYRREVKVEFYELTNIQHFKSKLVRL